MKKELVFDIINFLVALLIFVFPVYFAYLGLPLETQILPSVLLVIPIVITLYKRRLETERQRTVSRAKKLGTLLVKLDRIRNVFDIGISLTKNKEFMDNELASLGWRTYFHIYGREVDSDFGYCDYCVSYHIKGQGLDEFDSTVHDFYFSVQGFRQLYNDLATMIQVSKKIPKNQFQNIQELEGNFEDFLEALNDWCDEDEEIAKLLEGAYPIRKRLKKISPIYSKTK
jgi:hypothetical protein